MRAGYIAQIVQNLGGLYGETVAPTEDDIYRAFSDALPEIARYCVVAKIEVSKIDTIKLLGFSVPHLLRIRSETIGLSRYFHGCLLVIMGKEDNGGLSSDVMKMIESTARVCDRLCRRFPPQHFLVYGYFKGFQEGLDCKVEIE